MSAPRAPRLKRAARQKGEPAWVKDEERKLRGACQAKRQSRDERANATWMKQERPEGTSREEEHDRGELSDVTSDPWAQTGGIQHHAHSEIRPDRTPKSRVDHSQTRHPPRTVIRTGKTRENITILLYDFR